MPTLEFTVEQLQKFFGGRIFHKCYDETLKMAHEIRVHADGLYPKEIIEERRPSESEAVKKYREKIWQPVTLQDFSKIITELNKIRRSSEWSVRFDESKTTARILDGQRLSDYCTTGFPKFTSITNWAFAVLLKAYLVDANALVCVLPVNFQVEANDYVQPFPVIYDSINIIDYVEDDYAVIKSTDKTLFKEDDAMFWGDIYFIFTTTSVQRWEQIKKDGTMSMAEEYVHNIGKLPCFKTKGIVKYQLDGTYVYKSRISPCIPRLNEALREYSDLQAEVVQHIFSEKWEFVVDECSDCKGTGNITKHLGFKEESVTCKTCGGTGNKPRGPYTSLQLKPPMAGETALPTPPIGYVQKDTQIVTIQDARIENHIYAALSAINMEFLKETPLNQSGTAKEVDRDSLNNFVNSVAEDIVAVMDSVVFFINEYRYATVVPNAEDRREMLPFINVPETYDLLSTAQLINELDTAQKNKLSPVIINALEVEFANKKFSNDPSIRDKVALMISLDPLSGISEDDKMVRLQNGGITKENYIISCNVQDFISRAIDEKGDGFYTMPLKEQKALLKTYAEEQIKAAASQRIVLQDVANLGG